MTLAQRLVRLVTAASVRAPFLWPLFKRPMTRNFDRLAPEWDTTRARPNRFDAIMRAVESIPDTPRRVLDVGTGTGGAVRLFARRWPEAEVVGVDASPAMIAEARRAGPGRFEVGDASALPYDDESFDLVTLNNMIPFFEELARVTAPGGLLAIAFSAGDQTPIYVPLDRVARELERRGFAHVADFSTSPGVSLLARKDDRS